MSKADPKHGRWILPVVIAALIGFTYVFVNALPPADVATTTTTVSAATTTTAPITTTSSTLPDDITAFLEEVDGYTTTARTLNAEAHAVNEAWEAGEIEIGETRESLEKIATDTLSLSEGIEATEVPEVYVSLWPDAITASKAMVAAADGMIDGLNSTDDGTIRRQALADYDTATADLLAAFTTVKEATP